MLVKLFRRMRGGSRLSRWAVRPDGWKRAVGYENGILVDAGGKLLFVAGQIAWDADQKLVGGGDVAAQFAQALDNVLTVVGEAGGVPEEIVRMTVYVTDKRAYSGATADIGKAWRERLGKHFPAMALVEVADLLEEGAMVEIEATAVIG